MILLIGKAIFKQRYIYEGDKPTSPLFLYNFVNYECRIFGYFNYLK